MIDVAVTIAVSTVLIGVVAAYAVRLLPTVRLQLTTLALLAVGLPLAGVFASGWVMFHMHDDVKILAVSTGSALSAVIGALFITRRIVRPLDELRDASRKLAAGDLTARAPTGGRPGEIAELSTAFNAMAADVERLFDARRQLVAWASHDLRTPVAAIQAMVEAIEDGLAQPDEYLPSLREQARWLSQLVDDLFELARIDAGALTLELRRTPLGDNVDSCLRALDAEARVRNVRLESRIRGPVAEVAVAPDKIERVLLNLLTNALRHTPSDGAVAVVVETTGHDVVVSVEDTGEGLPAGVEGRVFDGFWKADPARARTGGGGAGLGLTIARGLVEAQGGRMWAEPAAGGGARVAFSLPAQPVGA
jgi:signal transduction histidine kinase